MAQLGLTSGRSGRKGKFTLSGKRGAVAVLLALSAPTVLEAAQPGIGPTSSARVGISVSVAAKFGLATVRRQAGTAGAREAASYCVESNGRPALLPILLVRPDQEKGEEAFGQLMTCDRASGQLGQESPPGTDARVQGLLIVRPE